MCSNSSSRRTQAQLIQELIIEHELIKKSLSEINARLNAFLRDISAVTATEALGESDLGKDMENRVSVIMQCGSSNDDLGKNMENRVSMIMQCGSSNDDDDATVTTSTAVEAEEKSPKRRKL